MKPAILLCLGVLAGCGGSDTTTISNLGSTTSVKLASHISGQIHAQSEYNEIVQQLYVAYFGRPADSTGLHNFTLQLQSLQATTDLQQLNAAYSNNTSVQALINSFGTSDESKALYGGTVDEFITAIYRNVLNREPDARGKSFWVDAINNGSLSRGQASFSIMAGAMANSTPQGFIDGELIRRKIAVASSFTSSLTTDATKASYSGNAAAAAARTLLSQVTNTTDVNAYQTNVNSTITDLVNRNPAPPTTPSIIKGVAAVGLPLVNAIITVYDRTGKLCLSTRVQTDAKGYYEADTSKCIPPMVVRATGEAPKVSGVPYTWESISVTNNSVINISPMALMLSTTVAGGIPYHVWENLVLHSTPAQLAQKLKEAQATLIAAMRQSNIDIPDNFDFIHSPFAADGTGIDAILGSIQVTQDSTTGNIVVYDKTGTNQLLTINASTGVISKSAGSALWPDYQVFNSLRSATPREMATGSTALPDDTAIFTPTSGAMGTLRFNGGTHTTINVTANYNVNDGGISPLSGQLGNERLNAQVVAICTRGSAYAMLSKTATIVPLSELTDGTAMKMEQIGVSEGCPLKAGEIGPTSFQFSGSAGSVTTPNGVMSAAQFRALNQSTINSLSGYIRFLAFKVSVNGKMRYGLIERGLDPGNGQAPFMFIHVQQN